MWEYTRRIWGKNQEGATKVPRITQKKTFKGTWKVLLLVFPSNGFSLNRHSLDWVFIYLFSYLLVFLFTGFPLCCFLFFWCYLDWFFFFLIFPSNWFSLLLVSAFTFFQWLLLYYPFPGCTGYTFYPSRLYNCHKVFTNIIFDQNLNHKEMREITKKYKLPEIFPKPNWPANPLPFTFIRSVYVSRQLLTILWFFNRGPANYQLLCDFSTLVWPTTKQFCDFLSPKKLVYDTFVSSF